MAALIKVGAFDLPDPSCDINLEPIDKAERNARSDLIKERINKKVKIKLSWSYLTANVLASVSWALF